MNRTELVNRINSLPLFEMRDIKVNTTIEGDEFVPDKINKAICEVGENNPLAFVGPRYKLIQFKEVFEPMLNNIDGEIDGFVLTNNGRAMLSIFPDVDDLVDGNSRYGVVALNSVDCSTSVVVQFCIRHHGKTYNVPSKISGLRQKHTLSTVGVIDNFLTMIGPVKKVWNTIINEFPKIKIVMNDNPGFDETDLKDLFKELKVKDRMKKHIQERYEKATIEHKGNYTLWDFFVDAISRLEEKSYKSEMHKHTNIEKFTNSIFEKALMLRL